MDDIIYDPLTNQVITDPLELRKNCNKAYRILNQKIVYEPDSTTVTVDYKTYSKWSLITEHIINEPKVANILKIRDSNEKVINTSENKMYEALWDIIAKFNFMPSQSGDITHYDGKIEKRNIENKKIIKNILKKRNYKLVANKE